MDIHQVDFPALEGSTLMVPLVLIEEVTIAADSEVDFDLPLDYDQYIIDIKGLVVDTNGTNLFMRVSVDGGVSFKTGATDYAWCMTYMSSSNNPTAGQDAADTELELTVNSVNHNMGTGAAEQLTGRIIIMDAGGDIDHFKFSYETIILTALPVIENVSGCGEHFFSGRVNAVRLLPHQGNFATGKMRLWGVRV